LRNPEHLCRFEQVPDGACIELHSDAVSDVFTLLVHRSGNTARAWLNRCPHFSLPLSSRPGEFIVLKGERILCPHHAAVFSLEDGRGVDARSEGMSLDSVPIEVRDGVVCVKKI
jgi:nitrite reductase/ring-hydroxylating ferredoxin subunit